MDHLTIYARLADDFTPLRLIEPEFLEYAPGQVTVPANTRCILSSRIAEVAEGPLDGLRFDVQGSSWKREA